MESENTESSTQGDVNQDGAPVDTATVGSPVDTATAGSPVDTATAGSPVDTAKVADVVEILRPAIQADGGDIELIGIDVDSGVVTVQLQGACISCPASTITMKAGIERIMKDRVPGVTSVVQPDDMDDELDRVGSL